MSPNEKCDSMPVNALKSDLTAKHYRVSDKQLYDIYTGFFFALLKNLDNNFLRFHSMTFFICIYDKITFFYVITFCFEIAHIVVWVTVTVCIRIVRLHLK